MPSPNIQHNCTFPSAEFFLHSCTTWRREEWVASDVGKKKKRCGGPQRKWMVQITQTGRSINMEEEFVVFLTLCPHLTRCISHIHRQTHTQSAQTSPGSGGFSTLLMWIHVGAYCKHTAHHCMKPGRFDVSAAVVLNVTSIHILHCNWGEYWSVHYPPPTSFYPKLLAQPRV